MCKTLYSKDADEIHNIQHITHQKIQTCFIANGQFFFQTVKQLSYQITYNHMGACAGCMGPERRAEKYRVNRLTEDSPIRNSLTPSELPIRRHKDKVVSQLNESKKRLDHSNNLISLLSSSGVRPEKELNLSRTQPRMTSSAYYPQQPNQTYIKEVYDVGSSKLQNTRKESYYGGDQNLKYSEVGKGFQKSYGESSYGPPSKSPYVSQFKPVSLFSTSPITQTKSFILPQKKQPLSQLFPNKNSEFSLNTKSKKLINIPQLPQQEAKTPYYVNEMRRQNGEDVLRSGLEGLPKKIEGAPSANLHQYLKDLQ